MSERMLEEIDEVQRRNWVSLRRKMQKSREKQPHLSCIQRLSECVAEVADEMITNSEVKPDE